MHVLRMLDFPQPASNMVWHELQANDMYSCLVTTKLSSTDIERGKQPVPSKLGTSADVQIRLLKAVDSIIKNVFFWSWAWFWEKELTAGTSLVTSEHRNRGVQIPDTSLPTFYVSPYYLRIYNIWAHAFQNICFSCVLRIEGKWNCRILISLDSVVKWVVPATLRFAQW